MEPISNKSSIPEENSLQEELKKIAIMPLDIKSLQKNETNKKFDVAFNNLLEDDAQKLNDLQFQMKYEAVPTFTAVSMLSSVAVIASLATLAFPEVILPLVAVPIGFGTYAYITYKTHQMEASSKLPTPTGTTTTGEPASKTTKTA
jgi:hypothetical protein